MSFQNPGFLKKLNICLDPPYYRAMLRTLFPKLDLPEDLVGLYMSDSIYRGYSLNPYFDETFYRRAYHDVARGIAQEKIVSGLVHFINHGFLEGRFPNQELQRNASTNAFPLPKAESLAKLPDNAYISEAYLEFRKFFPFLDRVVFFNNLGRFLGSVGSGKDFLSKAKLLFDHKFYNETYLNMNGITPDQAFNDYMTVGVKLKRSPNRTFDEEFYVSFYPDVAKAVASGKLICGFQHYLISGEAEGRLRCHNLRDAIEYSHPGLTAPVAINRLEGLQSKLRSIFRLEAGRERTTNIVVPDINPDIFFGGYESIVNLARILRSQGKKVRIIKSESRHFGKDYFLYHSNKGGNDHWMSDIECVDREDIVLVGEHDRFICYSTWDAYFAAPMAAVTNEPRLTLLIQEYEPIFHDYGSLHFLCNAAYRLPHYALFNSPELAEYFRLKRIGVFAESKNRKNGYSVFSHVLTPLAEGLDRPRKGRTFFYYARPERHAHRNLFEIGVMALRELLSRRDVGSDWRFIGLGALSPEINVPLDRKHVLEIRARLPLSEYVEVMSSVDIGLSLMYAPHPSVIPFELLQTGAIVVTNTFENRTKRYLESLSSNLIAAECSLPEIVTALDKAFDLASDLEFRRKGIVRLGPKTWEETLDPVLADLESEGLI